MTRRDSWDAQDELLRLVNAGASQSELARERGTTRQAVNEMVTKARRRLRGVNCVHGNQTEADPADNQGE